MASLKVVVLLLNVIFAAAASVDNYRANLLESKEGIRPEEYQVTRQEKENVLSFRPLENDAQEEMHRANFQRSHFPTEEKDTPNHQGNQQFNGFYSGSPDAIPPHSSFNGYSTDNERATHSTDADKYSYSIGTTSDAYPDEFERDTYSANVDPHPHHHDNRGQTFIGTAPLNLYSHSVNGRSATPVHIPSYHISRASPLFLGSSGSLPNLPAVAYVSNPSPQSLVYGHDSWYQGQASLRQHLQTPYVGYAYRHFL